MTNQFAFLWYAFLFLMYLAAQVLVVHYWALFGYAFCFVYLEFLLVLPLTTNRGLLMGVGFVLGLLVDGFYDTLGIHAAASVLVAYLRPFYIGLLSSKEEIPTLRLRETGFYWFLNYSLGLIFLHHLVVFFLQQFSLHLWLDTFIRVIASSLFTVFVVILNQYLFYSPTGRYAR